MFAMVKAARQGSQLRKRPSWLSQQGIALVQGVIASALVSSVGLVGVDWAVRQAAADQERAQAQVLLTINSAAGNYMTQLNDQLVALKADGKPVFSAECSKVSLAWGTAAAVPAVISGGGCNLSAVLTRKPDGSPATTYPVQNGLQPTETELKEMGFLDRGTADTALLATELGVFYAGPSGSEPAPNGYQIVLYPRCIGAGTPATCALQNKALTSSVFNQRPFELSRTSSQNFSTLLGSLGPDGAISGPPELPDQDPALMLNPNGEFRAIGRGWTRDNPVKRDGYFTPPGGATTTYVRGVDSLVMVRNGYDATTALEYLRRDGSSPPTADFDFNGKSITNLNNVQLNGTLSGKDGELTVDGKLKVTGDQSVGGNQAVAGNQSVSGNQDVNGNQNINGSQNINGNQVVKGNVTVGSTAPDGTPTGVFTALGQMFVNGATELKSTLSVAGNALFKGDVTFEKLIKGKDINLTGNLNANTANIAGNLNAGQLRIGNTLISPDGTLLGGAGGWGVNTAAACTVPFSLAQDAAGQLMICKGGGWEKLINRDVVAAAAGVGQACSPDGSPGKLADGTLVVCQGGAWVSTQLGSLTVGSACSVRGALGSVEEGEQFVLLGCDGSKWQITGLAKPKLAVGFAGDGCKVKDELVLEKILGKSLLICKNNLLVPLVAHLSTGNTVGSYCSVDGLISLDSQVGLLVCKNNVWKPENKTPRAGDWCSDSDNTRLQVAVGSALWCISHIWQDFPGTINTINSHGDKVDLLAGVRLSNGDIYYVYGEPFHSNWNHAMSFPALSYSLCDAYGYPECYVGQEDLTGSLMLDYGYWGQETLKVTLPTTTQLYSIYNEFGTRPLLWQRTFGGDHEEFWSRDHVSGVDGGYYIIDLWNGYQYWRYNIRWLPVVLRIRGWERLHTSDSLH